MTQYLYILQNDPKSSYPPSPYIVTKKMYPFFTDRLFFIMLGYHSLIYQTSVDRHSGCFLPFTTMNSVETGNIPHISFCTHISISGANFPKLKLLSQSFVPLNIYIYIKAI